MDKARVPLPHVGPGRIPPATIVTLLVLVGMLLPLSLYELSVFFSSPPVVLERIREHPRYDAFISSVMNRVRQSGEEERGFLLVPLNTLVEGSLKAIVKVGIDGRPVIEDEVPLASLRVDRLIVFGGSLSIVTLTIFMLMAQFNRSDSSSSGEEGLNLLRQTTTIETILVAEVQNAHKRSADLYSRSTLLLAGGIVMAFLGVWVFYITLPEHGNDELIARFLPKTIRPAGVLFFIEAIAWFLLRQYRALIEDYKWFHRLYLKRANYLTAYKLIENPKVEPETLFLAGSLLSEDFSGRLAQGESTESLEAQKSIEPNPIFELIEKIIGLGQQRTGN